MRNILIYLIVNLLSIQLAFGQDISVSASVDRNVISLDEQIVLSINISGNISNVSNIELPQIPNFSVYPSGRSQNLSIINGAVSSSVIFRYVLTPRTTGRFTIPSFIFNFNGQKYQTNPIEVEVTSAGKSQIQPQPQYTPTPQNLDHSQSSKEVFVTASVDKQNVFVNEQIIYTFRFYRRVNLLSNPQYVPPNFSGFWTEDIPPKNYYTTINGYRYLVNEIRTLIFPTKPGKYIIGSAQLQCNIEDFNPDDFFSDDFFRNFFSGGRTQILRTKEISINVLPLPEKEKPSNFSGAVGNYSISASLDKHSVKTNEAVTLSITISGTGNIKTILEPKIFDSPDFKKYESVSSLSINKDSGNLTGSKTFKIVIVPLTPGKKIIPSIQFVYFDPSISKYKTISTQPLILDVSQGTQQYQTKPSIQNQNEIKVISQDIRYIKTLKTWYNSKQPYYKNRLFIFINTLPLIILLIVFIYTIWHRKLSTDTAFARKLKAFSNAKKYLKKAKSIMKKDNSKEFYGMLTKAVFEYIANKLNLSSEGLTIQSIIDILNSKKIKKDILENLKTVLDECDMYRFAPIEADENIMKTSYNKVSSIIDYLEKELK